jgi:hypothetical protein
MTDPELSLGLSCSGIGSLGVKVLNLGQVIVRYCIYTLGQKVVHRTYPQDAFRLALTFYKRAKE